MRIEKDALGAVEIPDHAAWGPQTERSRHNFPTGPLMPAAIIRALLTIKAAAAAVNMKTGLDQAVGQAIIDAETRLQALPDDQLMADFPLHLYQTGSGTQTNMNVNEVLAHLASAALGRPVLPNDDVNRGQSSNDTFPTAMHMAAYPAVTQVCRAADAMIATLKNKEQAFTAVVKLGRTHLQDATPLTFGQEVSGWRTTLALDVAALHQLQAPLLTLTLGGTAVGTGLNTTPQQTAAMVAQIAQLTGLPFKEMANKFHGLAFHSELTAVHGALKTLAADLMKIANDIRFLASGPRGGYGELTIPANEPGSSIMPGKVNPTQAEALTMIAVRVMANDSAIAIAESQGNFELNVYKPLIGATLLESCTLLTGGMTQFNALLLQGLQVNQGHMRALVDHSLMLVTALSPHIGYAKAAKLAQTAQKNGQSLREAAITTGAVTAEQYDAWVDPLKMTHYDQK